MKTSEEQEEKKKCTRCKVNLPISHFVKKRNGEYCKQCIQCNENRKGYYRNLPLEKKTEYKENRDMGKAKRANKEYYERNREEINSKRREKGKEVYAKNREKESARHKNRNLNPEYKQKKKESAHKRYLENRESINAKVKAYREVHKEDVKERIRKWKRNRYHQNSEFKIMCVVRSRMCEILKRKKTKKTVEYLGCTIEEFKAHIQQQFKEGMTWENHGQWHIDHIIPLKYQNPSIEEVIERLYYRNTQPLWANENIQKSNKYIG